MEIAGQVPQLQELCAKHNVGFGIFLNPGVGIEAFDSYADVLDRLLVMTVHPGFAGQDLIESTLDTISSAVRFREEHGLHYDIEVDGCCNETWYRRLRDAGAQTFVLGGSGLFGKDSSTEKAIEICRKNLSRELAE